MKSSIGRSAMDLEAPGNDSADPEGVVLSVVEDALAGEVDAYPSCSNTPEPYAKA